jgi:hypothetical protein
MGDRRCPPNGYEGRVTPSLVKLAIVFLLTVLPLLTVFFMVLQVLFGAPRPVAAARPQRVAARKPRPAIRIAPTRIPSPVMASIRQLTLREEPQSRQKVA